MTDTLETLVAKQAITEVLHRYCYAMDRIDPELGAQIWHADGMAHYGPSIFEGSAEDYLKQVFEQHAKTDATSHQLTNVVIHLDGDRATARATLPRASAPPGRTSSSAGVISTPGPAAPGCGGSTIATTRTTSRR